MAELNQLVGDSAGQAQEPVAEPQADLLGVSDLVRMFEESEDATVDSRRLSERDRDYYDNKQLSSEEIAELKKRGQPPVISNRIKGKIDYLLGLEKTQRVAPKALPRTPVHEADADAATEALRYVNDDCDYANKRSGVWKNMLIEGAGGISVSVTPSKYQSRTMFNGGGQGGQQAIGYDGFGGNDPMQPAAPPRQFDVVIRRIAWDRMFADPHSSEPDYSDAGYLGVVLWMNFDDALEMYGEASRAVLEYTLSSVSASDTYDDKPKHRLWADAKRKRVRIVQMWLKRGEQWHFAEFTKGGILKAGPSPYVTDTGESDCELIFQAAYVDRDNNTYGIVREMISPQDEINKRRSKSLHQLNTAQIVMTEGALSELNDIEKVRKEAAKPDGVIVLADGNGTIEERFQFNTRSDLASAQFQLLQESKNEIDLKGPNATQMGDKAQGSSAASGKAIVASQQGGMLTIGDVMDNLHYLDKRVYRAVWNRIRQYWTAEKWIRVTDDENNVKWVGVNVDRAAFEQAAMQNPEMAKRIQGVIGIVAELDCDIIIDDVPDSVTPQLEQFQALVGLKQFDTQNDLSFRALIVAAPNLKNKDKILAEMDKAKQPNPQAQQMQQVGQELQLRGAAAEVKDKEASAKLKEANAAKAMRDAMTPADGGQPQPDAPDPFAQEQAAADLANTMADTRLKNANVAKVVAQTQGEHIDNQLAPFDALHRMQPQPPPSMPPIDPSQAA